MTQLTEAEAAYVNRMNPAAKKVGVGTRLRAVEGGSLANGTDGQVMICGADGVPAGKTLSGDVTNTNAGVVTVGNGKITAAKTDGSIKYGSGAGYTIALVQAAFGDPATLPDNFHGVYYDSTGEDYYDILVRSSAFLGVVKVYAAVPSE
jgi:hypothetical protein